MNIPNEGEANFVQMARGTLYRIAPEGTDLGRAIVSQGKALLADDIRFCFNVGNDVMEDPHFCAEPFSPIIRPMLFGTESDQ